MSDESLSVSYRLVNRPDVDYEKIEQNILSVTGESLEGFRTNEYPCARAITDLDLYIMECWLTSIDAIKIVEFGCGNTTRFLRKAGFDVKSLSIGISGDVTKRDIEYEDMDLYDEENLERILECLKDADVLLIDAKHSVSAARYYHKNIFPYISIPVWMHDVSHPTRPQFGEAYYMYENVVGDMYEVFIMTDFPFTNKIKQGRQLAKNCSLILNPIGAKDGRS